MNSIESKSVVQSLEIQPRAVDSDRKFARHVPGEAGIWLLIFGDMMVFSIFFVTFLYYRNQHADLYRDSQTHLNQAFGALNTFFMLSSSWFVAMAVKAARAQLRNVPSIFFGAAFLCGCGFAVVKVCEYKEKIAAGITLNSNDFFMYYYMFTGIHFAHVLIGMGVLAFLTRYTLQNNFDERTISHLESGASFWHVVDLLWIVLFALLYLVK